LFFEAPKAPNVTAQANGLGPGADVDRRAEGAPYVTSAQTCFDEIMSEDPHISRLQRSGEFGLTNPARWAGLLHSAPLALFTTRAITMRL